MRELFGPRNDWRSSLGAEWLAVAVDTGAEGRRSAVVKEHTARNLRLAEQLGAETQTLVGRNVADVLLDFARSRNVTKIVAGKTAQPRWKQWFASTIVDQLLDKSGDIDVYIVSGEGETPTAIRYPAGQRVSSLERVFQGGCRRRGVRFDWLGPHMPLAWPTPTS